MKKFLSLPAILVAALVITGLIVTVTRLFANAPSMPTSDVIVPALSASATTGQQTFNIHCADCHGDYGRGTLHGPALLHDYYNPGHHPDASFLRAVREGVKQHHWQFGDMPAQPQVTDAEVSAIVRYVRELQMANGIRSRPHRM